MPEGLLPKLTSEERDTLLVHELAHVRRRDHWVRLLELAVTVVFWWYPVTWWVRRALRRAEERCCDEWVLRLMPTSAQAYAEGLLKSLDHVAGEPDPLPVGASGAGPVRDLETRLKEILMMTCPTPQLGTPARVVLSVVAVLGLAVFPTQAQSPARGEEEEAPPRSTHSDTRRASRGCGGTALRGASRTGRTGPTDRSARGCRSCASRGPGSDAGINALLPGDPDPGHVPGG